MYFKVDEIRKVVDSELGFVADVPYIQSEAKVSSLEIMARNLWPIHCYLLLHGNVADIRSFLVF